MKKLFFLLAFLSCFSGYAQNQDSLNTIFPKNTIFIDILGPGFINYDRIFYQKKRFKLSYRVGFGIAPHIYSIDTVSFEGGKIHDILQNIIQIGLGINLVFPCKLILCMENISILQK